MTPNMGQGAAMSLEDVAVLCELICRGLPDSASLEALVRMAEQTL
jgi:2-polyprenyl-6-methoxyphenol hydroxylase-like FAD-dependent oxidoreductase